MEFNVISAIEEVMLIQQRKAEDNNIRLFATFENILRDDEEHELEHEFLGNDHSYMVNTDQQRVMQVLLGLQSNALKFTQNGFVNIRVRIKNQFLEIEVKDSGIGISEQNQKKLFKLFGFLQDSEMHNKNGVGLGLAISKQIVEQYDGKISLKSKLGEGSSFTFNFKIFPSEED